MTMIVGLAVNFSPDILNFVLVDYKGGGAFKPFAELPHCVDIVTNLNKAGVDRMFTAINAEIRRRQALNADTGTKDIVEYRQKGMHKTGVAVSAPVHHHRRVLRDDRRQPRLSRAARQHHACRPRAGRQSDPGVAAAQGRLATRCAPISSCGCACASSRPIPAASCCAAPDAALLPNGMPGRGYMQIGNENLELLQISYAGEPQPAESGLVQWPDRPEQDDRQSADETPRLFDAVVNLAAELYGDRWRPSRGRASCPSTSAWKRRSKTPSAAAASASKRRSPTGSTAIPRSCGRG